MNKVLYRYLKELRYSPSYSPLLGHNAAQERNIYTVFPNLFATTLESVLGGRNNSLMFVKDFNKAITSYRLRYSNDSVPLPDGVSLAAIDTVNILNVSEIETLQDALYCFYLTRIYKYGRLNNVINTMATAIDRLLVWRGCELDVSILTNAHNEFKRRLIDTLSPKSGPLPRVTTKYEDENGIWPSVFNYAFLIKQNAQAANNPMCKLTINPNIQFNVTAQ